MKKRRNRKRKNPIRLFEADGSFTEAGRILNFRLNNVVEEFIKEHPQICLNDVISISGRAGQITACREIIMRRKEKDRG